MKLFNLNESRPDWVFYDDLHPSRGDRCPVPGCRKIVGYKYGGRMGKPQFLGCDNLHAFLIPGRPDPRVKGLGGAKGREELESELERAVEEKPELFDAPESEVQGSEHTCRFPPKTDQVSRMDEDDVARIRQGRRSCEQCAFLYDAREDWELSGGEDPEEVEEVSEPSGDAGGLETLAKRLSELDPRRHHKPGEFGTGRVSPISPEDSPVMSLLKFGRDLGVKVDPKTGLLKKGKRKDKCGFGHTCSDHPSGKPAQNYPMPDPLATKATGARRYNFMFEPTESPPWNTFEWPISGMMGFKPKDEYSDYVLSKLNCPVCTGEEEGCDNPVAHEAGQVKPYCQEHMMEAPYARELTKFQGPIHEVPIPPSGEISSRLPGHPRWEDEPKLAAPAWNQAKRENIREGDEVESLRNSRNRWRGKETWIGYVVRVLPEGESNPFPGNDAWEGHTHLVHWSNPSAKAYEERWESPEDIDLLDWGSESGRKGKTGR